MNHEARQWLVRWKLLGCPDVLPLDMFWAIPEEAFEHAGGGRRWATFVSRLIEERWRVVVRRPRHRKITSRWWWMAGRWAEGPHGGMFVRPREGSASSLGAALQEANAVLIGGQDDT